MNEKVIKVAEGAYFAIGYPQNTVAQSFPFNSQTIIASGLDDQVGEQEENQEQIDQTLVT
jgi:hypothetical protein